MYTDRNSKSIESSVADKVDRSVAPARSKAQLPLLSLDLVALVPRGVPVVGLHLGPLRAQTLVDLQLDVVAAAGGLVHEALGVALLERSDDVLARWRQG